MASETNTRAGHVAGSPTVKHSASRILPCWMLSFLQETMFDELHLKTTTFKVMIIKAKNPQYDESSRGDDAVKVRWDGGALPFAQISLTQVHFRK